MNNVFVLAAKFAKYVIKSSNKKGHGVHSPFVYDFIVQVLNAKYSPNQFSHIEQQRKWLLQNDSVIEIEDFGAGSRKNFTSKRKVSDMAKNALKPAKYARLFYRIIEYYQCNNVVELGTCLGVTSSYLASANKQGTVITAEGSKAIAKVASTVFQQLNLNNIQLKIGEFNQTLPGILQQATAIDFVYLDGNHQYEPTVQYFNQLLPSLHANSIVVMDDIYWSKGMEKAWEEIKQHPSVNLTIDLFFVGLVFFKTEFKVKQHFTIWY